MCLVNGNGSMKSSILKAHSTSRHITHEHDNHTSLRTKRARFHDARTLPILWFVSEDTLGLKHPIAQKLY